MANTTKDPVTKPSKADSLALASGGTGPPVDLLMASDDDPYDFIVELFKTPDGQPWATIEVDGHQENWRLSSKEFAQRLRGILFELLEGTAPTPKDLRRVLELLTVRAEMRGRQCPVFNRVAEHEGEIYFDLANETWQAVKIDVRGFKVVNRPPVKFMRKPGMLASPVPRSGGSIEQLREFLNVETEDDFALAVSWVLGALRPGLPYPVLVLAGEQGSAKSTTARVLRKLVDDSSSLLRILPRTSRDIAIAASNCHVLAFDNLSGLSQADSDRLSSFSTGIGFSKRRVFTDDDEIMFEARRPIILTGIGVVATSSDLLDRSLILTLPQLGNTRRDEKQFWTRFEEVRPYLLGTLFKGISAGLKNLPDVKQDNLPRMADFAKWIQACESGLGWSPGTCLSAYRNNREEAHQVAMDTSSLAEVLRRFIENKRPWEGTCNRLLVSLNAEAGEEIRKRPDWPKAPKVLSTELSRISPNLRSVGITVTRLRRSSAGAMWRVAWTGNGIHNSNHFVRAVKLKNGAKATEVLALPSRIHSVKVKIPENTVKDSKSNGAPKNARRRAALSR